jgi:lia operon protein LiaF
MEDEGSHMFKGWTGRAFGGLVLLGAGVLLLLNMLGFTQFSLGELITIFWPVVVLLAGISQIINSSRNGGAFVGGLVVTAVGGYFMAKNLHLIDLPLGEFLKFAVPVVLIAAGLSVMFRPGKNRHHSDAGNAAPYEPPVPPPPPLDPALDPSFTSTLDEAFEQAFPNKATHNEPQEEPGAKGGPHHYGKHAHHHGEQKHHHGKHTHHGQHTASNSHDNINRSGFIGDVRIGDQYFELKPANISHFIGDTVIDLTKAQIPYGETKINVSAFIGDVKVFVPADADLGISVSSSSLIGDMKVLQEKSGGFMSSITSMTPNFNETSKRIKLNVSVLIGDIRVNRVG